MSTGWSQGSWGRQASEGQSGEMAAWSSLAPGKCYWQGAGVGLPPITPGAPKAPGPGWPCLDPTSHSPWGSDPLHWFCPRLSWQEPSPAPWPCMSEGHEAPIQGICTMLLWHGRAGGSICLGWGLAWGKGTQYHLSRG